MVRHLSNLSVKNVILPPHLPSTPSCKKKEPVFDSIFMKTRFYASPWQLVFYCFFLSNAIAFIYLLCVYMSLCMHACAIARTHGSWRTTCRFSSLLSSGMSWGLNSGHQTRWQAPLPTEVSLQLSGFIIFPSTWYMLHMLPHTVLFFLTLCWGSFLSQHLKHISLYFTLVRYQMVEGKHDALHEVFDHWQQGHNKCICLWIPSHIYKHLINSQKQRKSVCLYWDGGMARPLRALALGLRTQYAYDMTHPCLELQPLLVSVHTHTCVTCVCVHMCEHTHTHKISLLKNDVYVWICNVNSCCMANSSLEWLTGTSLLIEMPTTNKWGHFS